MKWSVKWASSKQAETVAYLQGAYDMCRLLLTSPRMNRPQREIIEETAQDTAAQLRALGVRFEGDTE